MLRADCGSVGKKKRRMYGHPAECGVLGDFLIAAEAEAVAVEPCEEAAVVDGYLDAGLAGAAIAEAEGKRNLFKRLDAGADENF